MIDTHLEGIRMELKVFSTWKSLPGLVAENKEWSISKKFSKWDSKHPIVTTVISFLSFLPPRAGTSRKFPYLMMITRP